jgi:glycosyltransferase involved in cell wall biosynthesis
MFPRFETIAPWALLEPDQAVPVDLRERQELFGDANLALLYSGNFGRAHSAHLVPRLAQGLRPFSGRVAFSVREREIPTLKLQMGPESAVAFAPFASYNRLQSRLSAADVHIVALRESWTGAVVPSKFFGSLAIGRPVLFLGSAESAVAKWIEEFDTGWVLNENTFESVVCRLIALGGDEHAKTQLFRHCNAVYREKFSRTEALDRWDRILRGLIVESKIV